MNASQRNDLVEEYGRGYDLLMAALEEAPREAWKFRPAPGEWSIHEIVIHVADTDTEGAMRARMLIAQPGSALMSTDDDVWCVTLDYQNQNADDALQLLKWARGTTYLLLKTLPGSVFMQAGIHPEAGYPEYGESYTLQKWLRIYTRHLRDHVEQIQKTHRAWREQAQ